MLYAPTQVDFWKEWREFQRKYAEFRKIILYIREALIRYRESWAAAWTNHILHLQQRATSRSEGAHYKIKSILDGHNDLSGLVHRIELLIQRQHREDAVETERQLSTRDVELSRSCFIPGVGRPSDINTPLFRDLWGHVSLYAIRQVKDRYHGIKQLPGPLPRCTQIYRTSTGFPCKHTIRDTLFNNQSLQPFDFHPHWQFFRGQRHEVSEDALRIYLPINDPVMLSARRDHSTRTTSTGRIASGFENTEAFLATAIQSGSQVSVGDGSQALAERSQSQSSQSTAMRRAPPKCSGCGTIGHTFRSCPQR